MAGNCAWEEGRGICYMVIAAAVMRAIQVWGDLCLIAIAEATLWSPKR